MFAAISDKDELETLKGVALRHIFRRNDFDPRFCH